MPQAVGKTSAPSVAVDVDRASLGDVRRAIERLLERDLPGVRAAYVATLSALRRRELATFDVCSRARLTKTPAQYLSSRSQRQELPYHIVWQDPY